MSALEQKSWIGSNDLPEVSVDKVHPSIVDLRVYQISDRFNDTTTGTHLYEEFVRLLLWKWAGSLLDDFNAPSLPLCRREPVANSAFARESVREGLL